MSEEIRTADAERAALRQAAQTAGIALWYSTEDEAYIAVFPAEPTLSGIGDTPGAALVELLVATRMGLESEREARAAWQYQEHQELCDIIRKNGLELHAAPHSFEVSVRDCQGYGPSLGVALIGLVFALRDTVAEIEQALSTTRADLDTLRNGVAWLGGELERVKAWAGLWKRKAKEYRAAAHFAAGVYRRRESRIQELRAAIEAERRVARYWNSMAVAWMRRSGAQQNSLETMRRAARVLVVAWRRSTLAQGWVWDDEAE